MSEPELVLDSASVKVWLQSGRPGASEFWVNFNGLRDFHITMSEFIRRRDASALHVVSKQDHWYRGRDMAEVVRFVNARTAAAGGGRVIVLGNSMGGFGALLHSSALRCDLVVAAGPQVIVDDDLSIGHDDRYRPEWQALETPEWLPWHDATRHCTRDVPIRLLYDPHAAEDRWHAAALRALPNVSLWRAPFGGHEVLLELRRAGLWVRALEAALDGDHAAWTALMPAFRAHRDQRFPYHLPMGMRHYRSGRLEHAARHFRRMTEVRPSFVEGHQFLAKALKDAGLRPQSIAALEGGVPHLAGDARYWWMFQAIANVNLEAGDVPAARDALLRGKAMFPARPELDIEMAKLRLHTARRSGDLSAAAKLAARAAAMDADAPEPRRLVAQIYAQRARFIAARGRARSVVAALERIVEQHPAEIGIRHELSRIYERDGRIADAIAVLEPVRPPDLGDPGLHWMTHRLATLHRAQGDVARARALLAGLARIAPAMHVINDLAELAEAMGDPAVAVAAIADAVAGFAENYDAAGLRHLAHIQIRAGDAAAAQATLRLAATRFPDDAETLFALAKFQLERPPASLPAAARLLRRAVALDPDRADYRTLLKEAEAARARRLAARGLLDAAARRMRAAADADPADAAVRIEAAYLHAQAGDRTAVVALSRAAVDDAQAGDHAGWELSHRLTALYAGHGDLAAAEASLVDATQRFPDVPETHFELGKFRIERPRPNPAAAARSLRRALALRPGEAAYAALLDRADRMRTKRLSARGRHAAASAILWRRAEADPADASRHLELADALEAAGRLDEAIASLRTAAALKRGEADGWVPLHRITALSTRSGDPAGAEAALAAAAAAFPEEPVALAELGKFQFEKEAPDFAEAARLLQRAQALAPGDERLPVLLRRCEEAAARARTAQLRLRGWRARFGVARLLRRRWERTRR